MRALLAMTMAILLAGCTDGAVDEPSDQNGVAPSRPGDPTSSDAPATAAGPPLDERHTGTLTERVDESYTIASGAGGIVDVRVVIRPTAGLPVSTSTQYGTQWQSGTQSIDIGNCDLVGYTMTVMDTDFVIFEHELAAGREATLRVCMGVAPLDYEITFIERT